MTSGKRTLAPQDHHRFVDEAGDMTFHSRLRGDRVSTIGTNGVSRCFMVGMVHVKSGLEETRSQIRDFCQSVDHDEFFQAFPSVRERTSNAFRGFFPHASKDPSELRYEFLRLMSRLDFTAQVVVGRKIPRIFIKKHQQQPSQFYADMMSNLLKDKARIDPLIVDVAERGSSTSNLNLQNAVSLAHTRSLRGSRTRELRNRIKFNVQPYDHELLLALADYSLWTVQRVYERGDGKYLGLLGGKVTLVLDLYDSTRYEGHHNYYTKYNPLTPESIGFNEWRRPEWPLA